MSGITLADIVVKVRQLVEITKQEQRSKERRIELEEEVTQMVEMHYQQSMSADQQKTYVLPIGALTIKRATNWSLANSSDIDTIQQLCPTAVKIKTELNSTTLKHMRDEGNPMYARLTPYLVSKPAKTAVKIVLNDGEE